MFILTINISLANVLVIFRQSNLEIFFRSQFSKCITIRSSIISMDEMDAIVSTNNDTA